ncbi:MAG: hypothetical protein IPK98_14580 [Chloracidobacterium sp.]|nr:hypothetical protein [Chloracidobacterium sp.]
MAGCIHRLRIYSLCCVSQKSHGLTKVYIHCILDGLDVAPRTADIYVEALEIKLADIGIGEIATLCGRFFAMDSAERWETHGPGIYDAGPR